MKNMLAQSTNPYLLQHKDNPVHWLEWNEKTLEIAKKENKCLLISIGYSACHWCHVMAHESFEDEDIAKIMNQNFINIKIDREERPDIDQIYMDAAQILTGRGGWPLNAFALPDGRPFYAGTYFHKENWLKVLQNIANAYKDQPEILVNTANRLTEGIKNNHVILQKEIPQQLKLKNVIDSYQSWYKHIDFEEGGINKVPKFPMPCIWQSLLDYYTLYKDKKALEAVTTTLHKMYHGGIYDWVEGGFARYSVDGVWFAPHFEKMLYDNAQLLGLYADAYKVTKNTDYYHCANDTIAFLNTHLKLDNTGYYAALDADSEGIEGYFYTWKISEIEKVLQKEEFVVAKIYFNLKLSGNWENQRNILAPTKSITNLADLCNLKKNEVIDILSSVKDKLKKERNKRKKPHLDNKLITAHNAMMVKSLCKSYQAFTDHTYFFIALELMDNIIQHAINEDYSLNRLMDKNNPKGFLDDYVFMIEALFYCYEVCFDIKYLKIAQNILWYTQKNFLDEEKILFYYSSKNTNLIARKIEYGDNVIPSINAIMALNLYKFGLYFGNKKYTLQAEQMLFKVLPLFKEYNIYFSTWHQLQLNLLKGAIEVAITGPDFKKYLQEFQKEYWPCTIFYGGKTENLPILLQKIDSKKTQIIVCYRQTCSKPITEIEEAKDYIRKHIFSSIS